MSPSLSHNLPQSIQAILFATGESHSYASLAKLLETDTDAIASAVQELKALMQGHSIVVSELNQEVALITHSEYSSLIERIRKEELSKELSKASAETLAVIAYSTGISKSQIEFIRGVNVSYSLRALMMRGLIETRGENRGAMYYPTLELLQHFGVASIEELPDYAPTKTKLEELMK